MTSQGGANTRFTRGARHRQPAAHPHRRRRAPQAPQLDDALKICLLLPQGDPGKYDRAVFRWLGGFCLERPLRDVLRPAAGINAFDRLPSEPDQKRARVAVPRQAQLSERRIPTVPELAWTRIGDMTPSGAMPPTVGCGAGTFLRPGLRAATEKWRSPSNGLTLIGRRRVPRGRPWAPQEIAG